MKKIVTLVFFMAVSLWAIGQRNGETVKYVVPEIECMGVELDGSQTLRVWGTGRNKTDAIEQAKKNAVDAVLFRGIHAGDKSCDQKPLLLEVNAKEKYQYYFNVFFKDGGDYLQYTSTEDRRTLTNSRRKTDNQVKYGITIRVLHAELKQRLIDDQIIKP